MQPSPEPESGPRAAPTEVARRLTGDLPCVVCKYNLRSLSVLEVCPECGTPVRATVLAVVDPYAGVLQPIRMRRLTAAGMVVWAASALAAALLTWAQRIADFVSVMFNQNVDSTVWASGAAVLIVLSGIGAIVLIRPHARLPAWQSAAALGGVLCCLAIAYIYWQIHLEFDPAHTRPYVEAPAGKETRVWLRMIMGALLIGAVLGLRINARVLAARSMLLRMGRVDRQTMLAMAAVVFVGMIGDTCRLIAYRAGDPISSVLNTVGVVLIAMASALFTVGLIGVLKDSMRIASVILRPAASYHDVISSGATHGAGGA